MQTPAFDPFLRLWWNVSPLPQLLSLLIISISAALLVRWMMVRNGAFTRASANPLAAVLSILLVPLLVIVWSTGVVCPDFGPARFDQNNWKSRPWLHASMAGDVIDRRLLDGLTQEQVVALLGDGDDSVGDNSWWLQRPRDAFLWISSPELVVYYDRSKSVARYYLTAGLFSDTPDRVITVPSNKRIEQNANR